MYKLEWQARIIEGVMNGDEFVPNETQSEMVYSHFVTFDSPKLVSKAGQLVGEQLVTLMCQDNNL